MWWNPLAKKQIDDIQTGNGDIAVNQLCVAV